jgi:hypothetical protein
MSELCLLPGSFLAHFLTLKMQATCSSEMSVDFQWTTLCYIPEDHALESRIISILSVG